MQAESRRMEIILNTVNTANKPQKNLKQRLNVLFEKISADFKPLDSDKQKVFISGGFAAKTVTICGIGNTIDTAFKNAVDKFLKYFRDNFEKKGTPAWLILTFVKKEYNITLDEFCADFVSEKSSVDGFSFDGLYQFAFLKHECSGFQMLDLSDGKAKIYDAGVTGFLRAKGVIDKKINFSSKGLTEILAFECAEVCEATEKFNVSFINFTESNKTKYEGFEKKISALQRLVLAETDDVQKYKTVFVSVSDAQNRAKVFVANGNNLTEAWDKVTKLAGNYVKAASVSPFWVKADIVTHSEHISYKDFRAELSKRIFGNPGAFGYPYGISFDENFNNAMISEEFNSNNIWNYKRGENDFNMNALAEFFAEKHTKFNAVPEDFIKFKCRGFIIDEHGKTFVLNESDYEYGKRIADLDRQTVSEIITNSVKFLLRNIKPDGSFVYGYVGGNQATLTSYNVLRHAGSSISIMQFYDLQDNKSDEKIVSAIEKANTFLIKQVVYKDENTAFIADGNEIKLGGNGIGIIALSSYSEFFKTNPYNELIIKLANGILEMQENDGSYYHVLNKSDFSEKERTRVVYYDGEATYALCKAYSIFRDEKYLIAAEKAVNYFINNNYEKYIDHWVAYSLNEITKHVHKQEYFDFALKNAMVNLDTIYNRKTPFHTFFEMLTATFNSYRRLLNLCEADGNFSVPVTFDEEYFIKTIKKRADYMLNYFFYPEYAMYMKKPQKIAYVFNVRHWDWRVRIDDIQHFVGGYYEFYKNFEEVK
jgi:hypothetical protein